MTIFISMTRPTPRSTLFPYTTLFRSVFGCAGQTGEPDPRGALVHHTGRRCDRDRADRDHGLGSGIAGDRKSTRLNSSHITISYAVFCLKKKNNTAQDGWS